MPGERTASITRLRDLSAVVTAFVPDWPVPGESRARMPKPRSTRGEKRSTISSLRLSRPAMAMMNGAGPAAYGMRT